MEEIINDKPVEIEGKSRPRRPDLYEEKRKIKGALRRHVMSQRVAQLDDGGDVGQVVEQLQPADLFLCEGLWRRVRWNHRLTITLRQPLHRSRARYRVVSEGSL